MAFSLFGFRKSSRSKIARKLECAAVAVAITLLAPQALFAQSPAVPALPAAEDGLVSLQDAIDKAIAASPRLQAAAFGVAAAAGSERQSQLLPNPEASIQVENVAGTGAYGGLRNAETTAGVSQLIELGGKRAARQDAAAAVRRTAETDANAARLDLVRDVTAAYAEAVAADETLSRAREMEAAAKQVFDDVTRRVNAARDPLFQRSKAEVAYTGSTIARQRAEAARAAGMQRLARYWGAATVTEPLVKSSLPALQGPQPLAVYEEHLRMTPDILRFESLRDARAAELRLAEAGAVPDVRASAGVKHFSAGRDTAFMLGLSIPIPIFNQNQGEIVRARAELAKVVQESRQVELERSQELMAAWSQWQSAWAEAESLSTLSLPQAERAFNQALTGYRGGAFEYLDVLDAQRTLFDVRNQFAEALARVYAARAQVERLTAQSSVPAQGTAP